VRLGQVTKQPGETETYTITYEDDLTVGDNVLTATMLSVAPTGLVISNIFVVDPRVRFAASGGVTGTTYKVTFRVTTEDGRILEDEVTIKVKEL
jgi:hypothetical protein